MTTPDDSHTPDIITIPDPELDASENDNSGSIEDITIDELLDLQEIPF